MLIQQKMIMKWHHLKFMCLFFSCVSGGRLANIDFLGIASSEMKQRSTQRVSTKILVWIPQNGEIEIKEDLLVHAANLTGVDLVVSPSPSPSSSSSSRMSASVTPKTAVDPLIAIEACLLSPPTTLPSRLGFGKRQKMSSSTASSSVNSTESLISESGIEIRDANGLLRFGFCPFSVNIISIGHWSIEGLGFGIAARDLTKICALLINSPDDGVSLFFNTTDHLSCVLRREQGFVEGMSHINFSSKIIDGGSVVEILALIGACMSATLTFVAFLPKS